MRKNNPAQRPEIKEKISNTLKRKYESGEIPRPIASEETRTARSLRMLGENNPNFQGKSVEKIRSSWDAEWKKKISRARSGRWGFLSKELNPVWYERTKIAARNPERRKKIRLARIAQLKAQCELKGDSFTPNFSIKAIPFFKLVDEKLGFKGQYAMNPMEYETESGYFLDYINFDAKWIIEWDERHHFEKGLLREKDLLRQKEIQNEFPNFRFIRVNETSPENFSQLLSEIFTN